jgi:hypothetical protein
MIWARFKNHHTKHCQSLQHCLCVFERQKQNRGMGFDLWFKAFLACGAPDAFWEPQIDAQDTTQHIMISFGSFCGWGTRAHIRIFQTMFLVLEISVAFQLLQTGVDPAFFLHLLVYVLAAERAD